MASALGFALAQPVHIMMLVFTMLGFGLGAPFLLLTVFPGMAKFLPRPGQWMVTLRQVLAFPLLLTVIWLLWVFNKQMGADQPGIASLCDGGDGFHSLDPQNHEPKTLAVLHRSINLGDDPLWLLG